MLKYVLEDKVKDSDGVNIEENYYFHYNVECME